MIGIQFVFYAEWVKFGDSLQSDEERICFYKAISKYGLYGAEPHHLTGETLAYFNSNVRPIIDKQHKRR